MKFNSKLDISKETLHRLSEAEAVHGGLVPRPLTNCCPTSATNNTYYAGDKFCVLCSAD